MLPFAALLVLAGGVSRSHVLAFLADSGGAAAVAKEAASPSTVAPPDHIFSEDFESGDTSEWSATPNDCPAPTGGPTLHSSVASNQTWTANTSPHVVTTNIVVPLGVTLTVSPCAEVRIRPGFDITVQGTLIARGTALQRITIRRDNPALPFDSLWVKSTGFLELAYVDLSGGGAGGAQGASVIAEGNDGLPPVLPLLVDHLRVVGSTSYGLKLFHRAGFAPGSRDLVVQGSGATDPNSPFPVRMSLNTVGTLPTGSYTGNASDLIQVVGEGGQAVEVDDTFHDRGVPYHVGGTLGEFGIIVVHSNSSLPTLTIDAGVEIRFFSSGSNIGGLFVGSGSPNSTGRIVANGTALAPVVFTGAGGAPLAGSWEGITFFGAVAAGNVLDHVQINAAGRNGGDGGFGCPPVGAFAVTSGALKIFEQPSSQFLTNSTISNSSTHGVFRAWEGAQVDFLAGNTFTNVAFCNQVLPKSPAGLCPPSPTCS